VSLENVALPEAVRKQGEAALAAQSAYSTAEGEIVDVIVDTPQETTAHSQQAPELPPVQETTAEAGGDWEHKYRVLQGKFDRLNADSQRYIEALQRANETNDNLNNLIVAMQQNTGGTQPQDASNLGPAEPGTVYPGDNKGGNGQAGRLDAGNFEGYGEEMVEMVNLVNRLVDENSQLKGEVGSVRGRVEQTTQTGFYNDLDKLLPNWKSINQNPNFLAWLKYPDEISGQVRHEILQDHFNRSDAEMVSNLFRAWATANGVPVTLQAGQGQPSTPPISQQQNSNLAGQIVPEGVGNANPADLVSPPMQMITREQYHQASQDAATNRITMEEFAAITKKFQKLIQEGKVK
jgi:hypothetical protein